MESVESGAAASGESTGSGLDPLGQATRLAMRSSPHPFSSLTHIDTEGGGGGGGDSPSLFVLSRHPPAATYLGHLPLFRSVSPCCLLVDIRPYITTTADPALPTRPYLIVSGRKQRNGHLPGATPFLASFFRFILCFPFSARAGWEAVWLVLGVFVLSGGVLSSIPAGADLIGLPSGLWWFYR